MYMFEQIIQWIIGLIQFILGILIGSILTGVFTWKVVVPKVMKNRDVQKLITELKEAKEVLENFFESEDWQDMVKLFREGKDLLKKILENQEKRNEK